MEEETFHRRERRFMEMQALKQVLQENGIVGVADTGPDIVDCHEPGGPGGHLLKRLDDHELIPYQVLGNRFCRRTELSAQGARAFPPMQSWIRGRRSY